MLLDRLEEKFHMPPCLVETANRQRWQTEMIGQEYQRLSGIGILEADFAQVDRILVVAQITVEHDGQVADDADGTIDGIGVQTTRVEIALGSGHEERASTVLGVEPFEIDVGPVHDVECSGFDEQDIEHVYIVPLAVAYMDKVADLALQVEQGMHFDSRFSRSKRRPRKQ